DHVPNLPWDIPGWIWDMITFGTSIYPKSEVRFGMYEIRIPVWDIPKLIWDIGSVDRKSTRLNSSHLGISYAVFCLKKKKKHKTLLLLIHLIVTLMYNSTLIHWRPVLPALHS